jgi:hypothetical protein
MVEDSFPSHLWTDDDPCIPGLSSCLAFKHCRRWIHVQYLGSFDANFIICTNVQMFKKCFLKEQNFVKENRNILSSTWNLQNQLINYSTIMCWSCLHNMMVLYFNAIRYCFAQFTIKNLHPNWFGLYVHLLIFKFWFQIFVDMIGNWQILPKERNSVLENRTFIRFWIQCK